MDLRQCRLSKDGEHARDDLLEILYPNNSYNASQLKRDTGLDRGKTIAKILNPKGENLRQTTLEQFFRRLLPLLKSRIDEEQFNKYLDCYKLIDSYKKLLESEANFYLPNKFYISGDTSGKTSDAPKGRQESSKSKSRKDVTDLFWDLDYENQEREFLAALKEQNQCVAFSITAPCDTTQRWILNRLMRKIPNLENALILPAISLKQHPMRYQFDHFWEDLSQRLKTNPLQDDVLKGMCRMDANRPIILTIYDFRQFKKYQEHLFQKFWEPLTQAIVDSNRSKRSRIVLFLVDQSCLSYDTKKVVRLDPLEVIPQNDVMEWFSSDSVASWWQPKFGDDFEKVFATGLEIETCQEPYFVLDRICVGLEMKLLDIEEAWKWAS